MSDGKPRTVFAVALHRPVAILMVTVAAVVFGVFSYRLLSIELMPDITYPSLTVRTEYAGAAPQEVEENLTRPIEEALGVVGGLVRLSSVSRAGLSDVTLEFQWDTAMSQAWQEVTERLDTVLLPEDARKPLILRYDPSLDPVLRLVLASSREDDQGPEGLKRLRTFAEQELKRRLEQVDGVASVRVLGGLEEQVSVEIDEEALRRTGLSIETVASRLEAENVNLAGGDIREGDTEYLVRTVNEFQSLDEIAALVVARVQGRDVRLRDVGSVRSGWADRVVITRLARSEAVEIEIRKEADANLVSAAQSVRLGVDGLRGDLPEGWELAIVSDRSTFVAAAVREVRNTALIGGLLAVIVLYLFLRDFRPTAVISVSIPVSVAATFAPMNLSGLSLNVMSLGGLALGVGMLVDAGIVVIESIARCREEGDDVATSVVRGTREVGGAVTASTLTTVAVFFPMVFVEGVAGQVFGDLALTVVYALLASVAVALFVVPALAARVLAGEAEGTRAAAGERIRRVLTYRALGPIAAGRGGAVGRALLRILPAVVPILALGAVLQRIDRTAAFVAIGIGAALVVATLIVNLVLRLRDSGRHPGRWLAAVLALAIQDPLMIVLEGLWIASVAIVGAAAAAIVGAARAVGRLSFLTRPLLAVFDVAYGGLRRVYPSVIRSALDHRAAVLSGALLAFVLMLVGFLGLDSTLLPEVHQGEFDLEVTMPVGTPLEGTLAAIAPIESWALADPRVERFLVKVGADPEADAGPEEGDHTARLTFHVAPEPTPRGVLARLVAPLKRIAEAFVHAREGGVAAVREERLIADLRGVVDRVPDLDAKIARPVLFSFRTPIEIEVEAFDLETLRRMGEAVRSRLESIPGLTDVETSARPGSPEVQIVYDREALIRLGLDLRAVADLVRTKVLGSTATEYRKRERRIDVVVRLEEGDRATVRQLRNLTVNPDSPTPIPLSAVADVRVATGPADIRRVGQRRVALVTANLEGFGIGRVADAIRRALDGMSWPPETRWRLAGQAQEMERSGRSLWIALGLSVFLVYVVMASQFESLLHPMLIMVTVPLALLGVVAVLHLFAIPLSVVVLLGMIVLVGIVVNNAIVFIDYTNTLRGRGKTVEQALIEAGTARLRPILMTTGTTVLGLVPMALGLGDGAEIRTPLAITVIAGLVSSTVLTLVVLPTVYAAAEGVVSALRERRTRPVEAGIEP